MAENTSDAVGLDISNHFNEDMALLNDEIVNPEVKGEVVAPDQQDKVEGPEEEETESVEEEEQPEEEEGREDDKEEEEPRLPHSRPTVKAITTQFPEFFKKFPELRHTIFREQEYTKLFPTVDDAKDAQGRATDFTNFSDMLRDGGAEKFGEFLQGVNQGGSNVLRNMAANFLPQLFKTNKDLYYEVTTPVAETMLRNAHRAGDQAGNENLKNAAMVIAKWALGDLGYATGEKKTGAIKPVKEENKDQDTFYSTQYTYTKSQLTDRVTKSMRADLGKTLDPSGVFTDFTRGMLIDRIISEVGDTLEKDPRHMAIMNSLWKQGYKEGYRGNYQDRLVSAFLSSARAVLPGIRAKIRTAAMATEQQKVTDIADRANRSSTRRDVSGGGNVSGQRAVGSKTPTAGEIDWRNTSDLDFLNDNIKTRK